MIRWIRHVVARFLSRRQRARDLLALEREADTALIAADPQFARQLGVLPPPFAVSDYNTFPFDMVEVPQGTDAGQRYRQRRSANFKRSIEAEFRRNYAVAAQRTRELELEADRARQAEMHYC